MNADAAPGPAAGPVLTVQDCAYSVQSNEILKSISFSAAAGEFIGLIGPNGSGKTTLLKVLDRILRPQSGLVLLNGQNLNLPSVRDLARQVSFMMQEPESLTAFEVIEIVLLGRYPHLTGLRNPGMEDREKAERALEYVGMAHLKGRYFNEISAGERQLSLFAKMLAQETQVMLLDEPTSNLDIRHRDRIFSMARELSHEGKTVIAAIHDLNEAARYCSRLILLDRGSVAADGTPESVLKSATLDPVYGVRTRVGVNSLTGGYEVQIAPRKADRVKARIHLIGGAGSAINLTRELYRLGYSLTGGIAHAEDSDSKLWGALDLEYRVVPAFSRIGEADIRSARELVETADACVLCAFPLGPGNEGNLTLASFARELLIVRGDRAFFSDSAKAAFEDLAGKGRLLDPQELTAFLERKGTVNP